MVKMILRSVGTITAIATPIVTVISCGNSDQKVEAAAQSGANKAILAKFGKGPSN